jgi:hypothetical protein
MTFNTDKSTLNKTFASQPSWLNPAFDKAYTCPTNLFSDPLPLDAVPSKKMLCISKKNTLELTIDKTRADLNVSKTPNTNRESDETLQVVINNKNKSNNRDSITEDTDSSNDNASWKSRLNTAANNPYVQAAGTALVTSLITKGIDSMFADNANHEIVHVRLPTVYHSERQTFRSNETRILVYQVQNGFRYNLALKAYAYGTFMFNNMRMNERAVNMNATRIYDSYARAIDVTGAGVDDEGNNNNNGESEIELSITCTDAGRKYRFFAHETSTDLSIDIQQYQR